MNEEQSSAVESLLCTIAHKQKLILECRDIERRTSSDRNGYECVISNTVQELAKQLVVDLGKESALALTRALIDITGWKPPVSVKG